MAKGYPKPREDERASNSGPTVASRFRWILPDDLKEEAADRPPADQARMLLDAWRESVAMTGRTPWPSASSPDFGAFANQLRAAISDETLRKDLAKLVAKL